MLRDLKLMNVNDKIAKLKSKIVEEESRCNWVNKYNTMC